jgi:hypothetical protein
VRCCLGTLSVLIVGALSAAAVLLSPQRMADTLETFVVRHRYIFL